MNYEKYVRQLEKKHKFAYNDIDQPWQSVSSDDSLENDSHEFILKEEVLISVKPVVRDTKHQTSESSVVDKAIVPVIEAAKQQDQAVVAVTEEAKQQAVAVTDIVADVEDAIVEATTTQEKILAEVEENVPATTTQEKLLAVAEDDDLSVTTTQENLLADKVLDESEPVTEQEIATIVPANEPVEDSTALPVVKVELVEESLVKVAQVEISEGSDQQLIDSTNADEGSDAAEVFKLDVEGSGSTAELVKEIQTTIQPEISNDEAATGTESTLLLNKDVLAGDETDLTITTELADTKLATTDEEQLDEKEVKSTDSPSADEVQKRVTYCLTRWIQLLHHDPLGCTDGDPAKLDDKDRSRGRIY